MPQILHTTGMWRTSRMTPRVEQQSYHCSLTPQTDVSTIDATTCRIDDAAQEVCTERPHACRILLIVLYRRRYARVDAGIVVRHYGLSSDGLYGGRDEVGQSLCVVVGLSYLQSSASAALEAVECGVIVGVFDVRKMGNSTLYDLCGPPASAHSANSQREPRTSTSRFCALLPAHIRPKFHGYDCCMVGSMSDGTACV